MSDLLLAPTARAAMELMGEMPVDPCRDIEFDIEKLLRAIEREQRKMFHEAFRTASVTQGLELSGYLVTSNPGYEGTYLN